MTDEYTCSEDYRQLCEARYVVKLPNKKTRLGYLALVRKARGNTSADDLEKRVWELWDNGVR